MIKGKFFTINNIFYLCMIFIIAIAFIEFISSLLIIFDYTPDALVGTFLSKLFVANIAGVAIATDFDYVGVVIFPFLALGIFGILRNNFLKWFGFVYFTISMISVYVLMILFVMLGNIVELLYSLYSLLFLMVYILAIVLRGKLKNKVMKK